MNVDIIKAVIWTAVTLAMLGLLVKFWRADRQQAAKLKELEAFKERYRCEMTDLYRWFASDDCALMVLDWLDRQLLGGELRPDDGYRLDVASQGLQAVRQAVRDSHFNDRCRGAADASCAMPVPEQPSISQSQIADLRDACSEGVHPDLFMALCVNEMLRGRTLKVITERREHLNPLDGVSAPVVRQIVNDLGERVWPRDENVYATEPDGRVGEARHVEVVYQLVKPTVDEKVDEVLRLVRLFENAGDNSLKSIGREAQQAMRETIRAVFLRNGFTVKDGQSDLKPYVYTAAEELLSIARASWQRTQSAPVSKAERLPLESLEPLHRPVPSGWAVKRPAIDARYVDNYLGPLDGWLEDPRRAVLFGNKEAAIAAQAALSVGSKLAISVVWLVYDPVFDTYREQAQ